MAGTYGGRSTSPPSPTLLVRPSAAPTSVPGARSRCSLAEASRRRRCCRRRVYKSAAETANVQRQQPTRLTVPSFPRRPLPSALRRGGNSALDRRQRQLGALRCACTGDGEPAPPCTPTANDASRRVLFFRSTATAREIAVPYRMCVEYFLLSSGGRRL